MPALQRFFDRARYQRAHSELAILDTQGNVQRIDRLVEFDDAIWVLDYKTGAADALLDAEGVKARHRVQLDIYTRAVVTLFPNKPVQTGIILNDGRLITL